MSNVIRSAARHAYTFLFPTAYKRREELAYWAGRHLAENGRLSNSHYEPLYTEVFKLRREDYDQKRVLDIGCGPRGSLEWADMAARRVGLDPLVPKYLKLGASKHKMEYAAARSEEIPFPDSYFDIVTCLNALDHVDDVNATILEIKRVTKKGGYFLLSVEMDHPPTSEEPITIDELVLGRLAPEFEVVTQFRVGTPRDHDLHGAVMKRSPVYVPRKPGVHIARYVRK